MCCNQNYIDQLTDEHKAKCTKFEQSNCRIAQVEAINAEHSEKDRQQKSSVKLVTIPASKIELSLIQECDIKQRPNLRPSTRKFTFETRISRFATRQSIGCNAPHTRHIVSRASVRLLRVDVDVTDVRIGTQILADAQPTAIDFDGAYFDQRKQNANQKRN